ncbi:MAG: 2'-5' RNA ligase family protein [Candidatus Cloacimonetes bacterium]|nr:2'-5' RNA ligase family protein [Candidatus Cloacimonadota bacterium]
MRCTFALLLNDEIHNYVRKKAVQINRVSGNAFFGAILPPHISLKQPFTIEDIETVEKYFDIFSSSTMPVSISTGEIYLMDNVIGLKIESSSILKNIHFQINSELSDYCLDPTALHDGDSYKFHLTIAMSAYNLNAFQSAYDQIKDEKIKFNFIADRIVMFISEDDSFPDKYITYKINHLNGK